MAQESLRILIAASGTGGHLMPALFIAQAIRSQNPGAIIEFVGSGRPLEETVLGKAGFSRSIIDIVGLKSRGLKGTLQFLSKLPQAVATTRRLLRRVRPDVIIGVGGYVTVLPVMLGRLSGIPTWIHEAERKPGMANFLLSFFVTRISLAFADSSIPCRRKCVFTGQPVRPELVAIGAESHVVSAPSKLLVMGGSQGAKSLDEAFVQLGPWLKERGVEVLHQCRPENERMVVDGYANAGLKARVVPFIEDVAPEYRWADLIVSRSGAGTVMEIAVVNRPVIFVPYPHAQANHQVTNAKTLASVGKALMVEEGEHFTERLQASLTQLLDPQRYRAMLDAPRSGRSVEAAEVIARGALALALHSKGALS